MASDILLPYTLWKGVGAKRALFLSNTLYQFVQIKRLHRDAAFCSPLQDRN